VNNNKITSTERPTSMFGLIMPVACSAVVTIILSVIILFSRSSVLDIALLCIIAIVWYACILQIKKYRKANTMNVSVISHSTAETGNLQVDPDEIIIESVSSIKHVKWALGNSNIEGLQVDHHPENALLMTNLAIWLMRIEQPGNEFIRSGKENTNAGMQFAENDRLNQMITTMTLQDILNESITIAQIPFANIKSIKTSDAMRSISITDRNNIKNIYSVLQYQEYEKAAWIADEWKKRHVEGNAYL
jgi:hypothetical protein